MGSLFFLAHLLSKAPENQERSQLLYIKTKQ